MSVRKLFKEYHAEYPDGYQLSSFKRAVRQYKFHVKVVGHVEHYAADQMYIDFAGDRLEVVDEMTARRRKPRCLSPSFRSAIIPTAKPCGLNARKT